MYKDLEILAETELKILEMLRHTVSMEYEIIVRMIFESKPDGERMMGRKRLRWLEDARQEIRETKVKTWRQKAGNRAEWKCVIKEAKALIGP
jgi:hypothetical protein